MAYRLNTPAFGKRTQSVVVDSEYRTNRAVSITLIAPRQVPGDWNTHFAQAIENAGISTIQLFGRQPAAQRIVDVGIGTGISAEPVRERGFAVLGVEPDPKMAAATRVKMLDMLAANKTAVMSYHFAWPGYGHVVKAGDGFRYIAEPMIMNL